MLAVQPEDLSPDRFMPPNGHWMPEQLDLLKSDVPEDLVASRKGGRGNTLAYIEAHDAIDLANECFGYDGWSFAVVLRERVEDTFTATVRLTVYTPGGRVLVREDVGTSDIAVSTNQQTGERSYNADNLQTAIKGAVTDGLKRCLRTFGGRFGNSLYGADGQQAAVGAGSQEGRPAQQSRGQSGPPKRQCPNCGGGMTYREGQTRDGRDYRAYFCDAKCGAKPIWINDNE